MEMTIRRWLNWKPPISGEGPTPEPSKPGSAGSAGFAGSTLGSLSKIGDASETETPIENGNSASEPKPQKLEECPIPGPAKPAKPSSAGFAGSILALPSKIEDASEAQAPVEPANSTDAGRLAALEPAISEFRKHFEITRVRVAGPEDRAIPYSDWKARELNRIFAEHGTGGAGRITAATVRDGLEKEANKEPAKPAKPPFGQKDGASDE
jgi:hypothetical protein